jgi:hypothetical protein
LKHERFLNFALLRSHRQLDPPGVTELVSELDRAGLLSNLRAVVEPLVRLFPTCPMSLVGMPASPRDRASLVKDLCNCVGGLLDRWSLPASAAQATVVSISRLTGGLIYGDSVPGRLAAQLIIPASQADNRNRCYDTSAPLFSDLFDSLDRNCSTWDHSHECV